MNESETKSLLKFKANKTEYEKVKHLLIELDFDLCSVNSYHLALIVNNLLSNEFVHTRAGFYFFNGLIWTNIDDSQFHQKMVEKLIFIFQEKTNQLQLEINDLKTQEKKIKSIDLIINNIKTDKTFGENIVEHCRDMMSNVNFFDLLDEGPYIGFNNGVYDLKANCFRKSRI